MRTREGMAVNGYELAKSALLAKDSDAVEMGLEDYESGLSDALVNLMHFAERYEIDFDLCLARATHHYAIEETYDWDEVPGLDKKTTAERR